MTGLHSALRRATLGFLAAVAALGVAAGPGWAQDPSPADPAAPSATDAEPGRVTVSMTPQETTVGGRVRAEITVVWMGGEPAEPVRFPTWQETWGRAEIVEESPVEAFVDQSGRHVATQILELTAFETGDVRLPSRTFSVPLGDRTVELDSEAAGFSVSSVLPDSGEAENDPGAGNPAPGVQDPSAAGQGAPAVPGAADAPGAEAIQPRGAAGLAELSSSATRFWATSSAFFLLLLLGLDRLRRQLAVETAADLESAAERDAYAHLEPMAELKARLEQIDPLYGGAAHTGLSLALRTFLGRTLGFNAVESTTTEIQRHLLSPSRSRLQPPPELSQRSVDVLRACDLVKFAGLEADPSTVRGRVTEVLDLADGVERFVEQSRAPVGDAPRDPAEAA
ncbi:MAG: hypothetical protein AAGM22_25605 [Acidobacteriota bacterium]